MPIPKEIVQAVDQRAKGCCEFCGKAGGFLPLHHAHIVHRKMGGREKDSPINEPRNIALLCQTCHDIIDRRKYQQDKREIILLYIKRKIGWDSWVSEYGVTE